jgi:hypothetical protein
MSGIFREAVRPDVHGIDDDGTVISQLDEEAERPNCETGFDDHPTSRPTAELKGLEQSGHCQLVECCGQVHYSEPLGGLRVGKPSAMSTAID